VEIIADKDTFHAGRTAPVMLVTPEADRYVLFTAEGQGIYHYQLVHLDGTVKLVNLAIDESYVPNVFLDATLVSDRQIFTDQKQIVVPPVKNFLTVDVKADRNDYELRQEGALTVTTRNDQGKPVSAEVALSLVDESVFYIQNDYAGDPRQFFFGRKRSQWVQTQSTMNQKSYTKLVKWKGRWIDDLEKERIEEQNRNGISFGSASGEAVAAGGPNNPFITAITAGGEAVAAGDVATTATSIPIRLDRPFAGHMPAGQEPSPGKPPAVVVRSDFRSTVFWQPDIMTGKNGEATVKVTYPDSLTSWRATARAVTTANQFGIAETTTRTRQPLIVRLEGPRFFVVGDTVTISAVVNNNTGKSLQAKVSLDANGLGMKQSSEPSKILSVPANGEARADWTATVDSPGNVKLKVTAWSGQYADAMEKSFTAYEHGIEKFISKSGKTTSDDTTVELVLPRERKPHTTSLTVQVTPSMAVTMLDALPYLIHYPYGCTEQTMSRFLPTVVTAKTLRDLGLRPGDVMGRVFGGIETNSAAATHPDGKKNLDEMNQMAQAGLNRLYGFQHGDGGWGWWK
ncbi:MAG: alpha-2-macroglobulin family protein, partial [Limisphaerales bacterium]